MAEPAAGPQLVLVVEDEPALAESIQYSLQHDGFRALVAGDGQQALDRFETEGPDLVLLDLMLPRLPGLDVLRRIRRESTVPIVIVTAKDAEADRVAGLELGADDYVTKPFSMRELVSRVRAQLRRAAMGGTAMEAEPETLAVGPVELNLARHEAKVRGEAMELPPKEFELLSTFLRRPGRLLTRETLIREVWGSDYVGDTKTLDVHVKRLRGRVEEDPHNPTHLLTVRGLGYRFVP